MIILISRCLYGIGFLYLGQINTFLVNYGKVNLRFDCVGLRYIVDYGSKICYNANRVGFFAKGRGDAFLWLGEI